MNRFDFPDAEACAVALADALGAAVVETLDKKARATLALSGGRSPEKVLPLLAAKHIDWARVDVTLVDDRRVAIDDPASNAGLVKRCFLDQGATGARFVPLWQGDVDLEQALAAADRRLANFLPADVAYLGMGPDGHIASLFPAENPEKFERDGFAVISSEAPSAPHGRISLTFLELTKISKLFLHVTGAAKIETLERALFNPPTPRLPVSLLIEARPDLTLFVCE